MDTRAGDREFAYRPRWSVIVGGALFFSACFFVLRSQAASNNRGLVINGLIELSPANATRFYVSLCWLSFGFVAISIFLLMVRLTNAQKLRLTNDGLHAPKRAWSRQPMFIAYTDVLSMETVRVSRQTFLKIVHSRGKLNVAGSMLESQDAFDQFGDALAQRVNAAGRTRQSQRIQRVADDPHVGG